MWIASLILSWKVVEAWSKMQKHSSEHREGHCGELCKCLKGLSCQTYYQKDVKTAEWQ